MLRSNNRVISEKVVRRLMAEEQLVVKRTRRRRYNSYCGEIGPAPENLLARDFSSCRPNEKWLTDIRVPASGWKSLSVAGYRLL
jgi:transposase InsO family protein